MFQNKLIRAMKERAKIFSHSIEEGGRRILFLFEPVFMIDTVKYMVTVSEGLENSSLFYMQKTNKGWKIINAPKIADHFLKQEEALGRMIEMNSDI